MADLLRRRQRHNTVATTGLPYRNHKRSPFQILLTHISCSRRSAVGRWRSASGFSSRPGTTSRFAGLILEGPGRILIQDIADLDVGTVAFYGGESAAVKVDLGDELRASPPAAPGPLSNHSSATSTSSPTAGRVCRSRDTAAVAAEDTTDRHVWVAIGAGLVVLAALVVGAALWRRRRRNAHGGSVRGAMLD
jgi:hypothetical protein